MSPPFRIRWVLPAILICVCVISVIDANCPPGWKSWRDSCYIVLAETLDWNEASRVCERPQSSLAAPNTPEENQLIHTMQIDACTVDATCGLWIGCRLKEGVLKCFDQTQGSLFTNWVPGFSNITSGCVIMSLNNNGGWQATSTKDCDSAKFVICEMPRQVPIYCLTVASVGRVKPQCLQGHEFKNVTAKGVIACGKACWAEPRCRSFNLWQGGRQEICQLNDATLLECDEGDVVYEDECNYFGL